MNKKQFKRGLELGVPIGLGYFSVSIAFGMLAVGSGLSPLAAVIISMTNLTSAGQFAGVSLIAAGGSYIEMTLTMLMINARYFLMSLSLSQKFAKDFKRFEKLLVSFGVTDEIFAVAALEKEPICSSFLWGLITLPFVGWSLGTLMGAVMSGFLPSALQDALGIALYGMFIALIIPAAKGTKSILITILIAVACSCILKYIPGLNSISPGFAVIIVTLVAAGVAAYWYPIQEEEDSCTSSSVS